MGLTSTPVLPRKLSTTSSNGVADCTDGRIAFSKAFLIGVSAARLSYKIKDSVFEAKALQWMTSTCMFLTVRFSFLCRLVLVQAQGGLDR